MMKRMHPAPVSRSCALLLFLCLIGPMPSTAEEQDTAPPTEITAEESAPIDSLQQIISTKGLLASELKEKTKELKRSATEEQQDLIRLEMQDLTTRIQALDRDFESIVSGVDPAQFNVAPDRSDWQKEMQELLSPILDELKKVTAHPREIETLRRQINVYQQRINLAESAVQSIEQHLAMSESAEVKKELKPLLQSWQHQGEEFKSRLTAAQQQLVKKQENGSLIDALGNGLRHFFRNRGMNLALALCICLAIFLVMGYARRWLYQKTNLGRLGAHRTFFLRLAELVYFLCTMLAAVAAFALVLYISEDWVMLGLFLFLLFSLLWTGKTALPRLWTHALLLLNMSTVREGERIMYQGLPWKVMALNFYTRLYNPDLRGGMLRLPLSQLIGLQSRPFYTDEPWFPTKGGDLVELADGTIGLVNLQTPEQVILDTKGGCLRTYPTLTFLAMHPINYSVNTFGVIVTFGIDYQHQAEATRTVPGLLQEHITAALLEQKYGADLIDILVEFKEAAESSLNILCFLKFPGAQAGNYFAIGRLLQRTAVEACTEHGWGIPFPQVTIHQANADAPQIPDTIIPPAE